MSLDTSEPAVAGIRCAVIDFVVMDVPADHQIG